MARMKREEKAERMKSVPENKEEIESEGKRGSQAVEFNAKVSSLRLNRYSIFSVHELIRSALQQYYRVSRVSSFCSISFPRLLI